MGYEAKILADSVSLHGHRLTTFQVTFPRIVLAEFNTHRMLSRNSASSRAIPVEKRIAMVEADPFMPEAFGKNQSGMQASEELSGIEEQTALNCWIKGRDEAVLTARALARVGVHKQLANRLLEPFLWHTVICSGTEWSNFFALRCHPDAQPEIRKAALMMRELYDASKPQLVLEGEWHRPLVPDLHELVLDGFDDDALNLVSIGRVARVSYLTHEGLRDPRADIGLAKERLKPSGHMSPFEHVARPFDGELAASDDAIRRLGGVGLDLGNYRGWVQYRKTIPFEHDFGKVLAARGALDR